MFRCHIQWRLLKCPPSISSPRQKHHAKLWFSYFHLQVFNQERGSLNILKSELNRSNYSSNLIIIIIIQPRITQKVIVYWLDDRGFIFCSTDIYFHHYLYNGSVFSEYPDLSHRKKSGQIMKLTRPPCSFLVMCSFVP
jgi:hypothetical protein